MTVPSQDPFAAGPTGSAPQDAHWDAEALAEAEAEAWGGQDPSESYQAWLAEGRIPEPEADP